MADSDSAIEHEFVLASPGDITTLDGAAVRDANPRPNSRDCPPNFFPYIEFEDAALPWRYTPANAPAGDKPLAPWLVLAVVEEGEDAVLQPAGARPNFCLSISSKAGRTLPDPQDAYNWAHVEERSGRPVARLIAPVRMQPNKAYLACLVPLFEAGKRAGLGRAREDVGGQPAWTVDTETLDLPVYYHWRFRTGAADFETLARRLVPRMAGDQAGLHDLDLARTGGGLNIEHIQPDLDHEKQILVSFAGGLTGPEVKPRSWPVKHKQPFLAGLTKLLADRPAEKPGQKRNYHALKDDPVVGPPVYGSWQANPKTLASNNQRWLNKAQFGSGWMATLNGDPALRAAAGLGARVVATNQEEFVAKAWNQLSEVKEVATVFRNSRFAMAASKPLHKKIAALNAPHALQLTEGVHDLVKVNSKSAAVIAEKTTTNGSSEVLNSAFTRLSVAASSKSKRIGTVNTKGKAAPTERLAETAITLAVTGKLEQSQAGLLSKVAGVPVATNDSDEKSSKPSSDQVHAKTAAPRDSEPAGDPKALRDQTVAELDPFVTVPDLVGHRVEGLPRNAAQTGKIARSFSFPLEFDEPTYRKLQKVDPDFLMPGFSAIPEDTVTIVEANPDFIEAFLIGMNHEMSREFAWRQMPLLLNGNWFRKFWDYRGNTPQYDLGHVGEWDASRSLGGNAARPEKAVLLIKSELFKQYPSTRVFAVKAEWGEPQVTNQAVDPTKATDAAKRVRTPMLDDPAVWEDPVFDGKIGATAQFFGFELSAEDLVGQGKDPGYFLMFEQGARDTQFGLDPASGFGKRKPGRADNLHWGHFAESEDALAGMSHAPADAPWGSQAIEQAVWGRNSAETAKLCLQRKVRMLFPARTLIDAEALSGGG